MSIFDRLFGNRSDSPDEAQRPTVPPQPGDADRPPRSGDLTDEQALERYRYLLRTAPPAAIEQAHAEAFAQLTPDQRRQVLAGLSQDLPPQERTDRDDPQSLARMATRAEIRRPGTLERTFGNPGGAGIGLGTFLAYDLLSTIAGVVIGTSIANAIFDDAGDDQGDADSAESTEGDEGSDVADAGYDSGDAGHDASGDFDGTDFTGVDFGGDEF